MQCGRCKSVVADSALVCPACGNQLGVDSYGQTSFAPVMPPAQPAAHVSVRNPADALGATMLSTNAPPTMASNAPPAPRAVITPAPQYASTPMPHTPTMQSPAYAPPPQPQYMMTPPQYPMQQPYPMSMQPQQGTPGLAVASLVCGLLGWIPLWIGFILCLLAITFGLIIVTQTKPGQSGRGLAIAGLILGLVLLLPAACGL